MKFFDFIWQCSNQRCFVLLKKKFMLLLSGMQKKLLFNRCIGETYPRPIYNEQINSATLYNTFFQSLYLIMLEIYWYICLYLIHLLINTNIRGAIWGGQVWANAHPRFSKGPKLPPQRVLFRPWLSIMSNIIHSVQMIWTNARLLAKERNYLSTLGVIRLFAINHCELWK